MNNYYDELYKEQQKTNEYLSTIDSKLDIMIEKSTDIINSLGLLASLLMILVVFYCVFRFIFY